jgi:hypothetical protein
VNAGIVLFSPKKTFPTGQIMTGLQFLPFTPSNLYSHFHPALALRIEPANGRFILKAGAQLWLVI